MDPAVKDWIYTGILAFGILSPFVVFIWNRARSATRMEQDAAIHHKVTEGVLAKLSRIEDMLSHPEENGLGVGQGFEHLVDRMDLTMKTIAEQMKESNANVRLLIDKITVQ